MFPREVFFLVGRSRHGAAILWSDASDSPFALPESRARWEAIWTHRETLTEIAHSHPLGPAAFSAEDETTMRALTRGLGRPLLFSVVAPDAMIRRLATVASYDEERVAHEPWWADVLRHASHMTTSAPPILRRPLGKETP